jgi:hypothetical protein
LLRKPLYAAANVVNSGTLCAMGAKIVGKLSNKKFTGKYIDISKKSM